MSDFEQDISELTEDWERQFSKAMLCEDRNTRFWLLGELYYSVEKVVAFCEDPCKSQMLGWMAESLDRIGESDKAERCRSRAKLAAKVAKWSRNDERISRFRALLGNLITNLKGTELERELLPLQFLAVDSHALLATLLAVCAAKSRNHLIQSGYQLEAEEILKWAAESTDESHSPIVRLEVFFAYGTWLTFARDHAKAGHYARDYTTAGHYLKLALQEC